MIRSESAAAWLAACLLAAVAQPSFAQTGNAPSPYQGAKGTAPIYPSYGTTSKPALPAGYPNAPTGSAGSTAPAWGSPPNGGGNSGGSIPNNYPPPRNSLAVPASYPPTSQVYPPNAPSGIVPASAATPPPRGGSSTTIPPRFGQEAPVPLNPNIAARPLMPNAQAPSIIVEKRGPEIVNVGQPLLYEIALRNTGNTPVYQVRVEDELPAGVRFVGSDPVADVAADRAAWNVGTLEAGAERRIRVEVLPSQECELRATATVTFSAATALRTMVVRPKLNVSMTGPDQCLLGDTVPFQINVTNAGSGPLTNLVLHDYLPAGLQHPNGNLVEAELGTLAPGESRTVTLRAVAAAAGPQINELRATAEGGVELVARSNVSVLEPAVALRRMGPAKGRIKSELTFELEVANNGTAPSTNVVVTDSLSPGMEFVGGSDGALYDPASRSIVWKLGTVLAGTKKVLSYRFKTSAIGDLPDKAVVQADRGLEAKIETAVLIEGVPALALEVVDLEDPIEAGADLNYEIRVVNQGSMPCTNVQITANVPEGLLPKDASGPAGYRIVGQQIVFEPLAKLAIKSDAVYRVRVKGVNAGDYRFKVQMTCEQLRTPVNKEESSRVYKD